MSNIARIERIHTLLTQALAPSKLHIIDDSAKHRGHAGAQSGAGHFQIEIAADAFIGKTPIARHRMVYAALSSMFPNDIHALTIHASLP